MLYVLLLSKLLIRFTYHIYEAVVAVGIVNPVTLYLTFAFVTLFSLFAMFAALGKPLIGLHWQAALLQVSMTSMSLSPSR
jgi:hypothetical protein